MNEERRKEEALFRYAVLGDLLHRGLRRGELGRVLTERARKQWKGPDGRPRRIAKKTLEEWFYRYRNGGFESLMPSPRRDRGKVRALKAEIEELIIAMKREDPGRSAQLILEELELVGRLRRREVSVSTIRRLLRREGLTGARMELERPTRLRWQASRCGELWLSTPVNKRVYSPGNVSSPYPAPLPSGRQSAPRDLALPASRSYPASEFWG